MTRRLLEPDVASRHRAGAHRLHMPRWQQWGTSNYLSRTGYLSGRLGIVIIHQFRDTRGREGTMIEAVDVEGFKHFRHWNRAHPDRTCARLARELLEDIV